MMMHTEPEYPAEGKLNIVGAREQPRHGYPAFTKSIAPTASAAETGTEFPR